MTDAAIAPARHVLDPEEHSPTMSDALRFAHDSAIRLNWEAFHVGVPAGFASYVYCYRDGDGGLIYVGMTDNATARATGNQGHYRQSDWWSWVMSAEYRWCSNRDVAFKLESKIRREQRPTFVGTSGNAALIDELDRKYMVNHVTGNCYCHDPDLTDAVAVGQPGGQLRRLDTSHRCNCPQLVSWNLRRAKECRERRFAQWQRPACPRGTRWRR